MTNHHHASTGLDRRAFLRLGAGAAFGASLMPASLAGGGRVRGFEGGSGRSLVLLQLGGGNDGLSTIVPHADDELRRVRKSTLHDPSKLLKIDDYRSFNPRLGVFRTELEEGRLAVVEGAGYPDPVRSHFKSYEVWHTARAGGRASGDGWVGRLVANAWGKDAAPDAVVHFGRSAPYSLFSSSHPAVALASPTGYRWFGDEDLYSMGGSAICEHEMDGDVDPRHTGRDSALAKLRGTLDDAAESSARVRRAAASYQTPIEYPKSALAAGLRDVAALLAADVGTRVFSITQGGYDTHTGQLASHDRNMGGLAGALGPFLRDLRRSGAADRTAVLVFSEFGRRVKENGSKGHDHGKAGPMFVFGSQVTGGLHGSHPSLTELDAGDLVHTVDFRAVYRTLIEDWLGEDAGPVLGAAYPGVELFKA